MSLSRIIGIDFGTNKTLVARWDEEVSRPVLVRLRPAHGDDMPSVVHVDAEGRFTFGDEAEQEGAIDPDGCKRAFKRDLGINAAPYLLHTHELTARDLSREYLRWIKDLVEQDSLHGAVEHAVITVPTSWLPGARAELKQAATEAGFKSLDLLDEPVAAGTAFLSSRRDLWSEGTLLVFDWGAGTLDLAVLTLKDGQPQVIPDLVGGKPGLGGEDVDAHLAQSVNKRLVQLGKTKLDRRSPLEIENVRRKVNEWKIRHATRPDASWQMTGLSDAPAESDLKWTSEEIATRIQDKIKEAVDTCEELLNRAKAKGVTPAGILLVGGSSQFSALRVSLEERFPEMKLLPWDQRISAVALGAVLCAVGQRGYGAITPATASVSPPPATPHQATPPNTPNPFQSGVPPLVAKLQSAIFPGTAIEPPIAPKPPEPTESIEVSLRKKGLSIHNETIKLYDHDICHFEELTELCANMPIEVETLCDDIQDYDIELLTRLSRIRKLEIYEGGELTDEALLSIARMRSLEVLDMGLCKSDNFTMTGWRSLVKLRNLKELTLPSDIDGLDEFLEQRIPGLSVYT